MAQFTLKRLMLAVACVAVSMGIIAFNIRLDRTKTFTDNQRFGIQILSLIPIVAAFSGGVGLLFSSFRKGAAIGLAILVVVAAVLRVLAPFIFGGI
jgi:hypothetical protein